MSEFQRKLNYLLIIPVTLLLLGFGLFMGNVSSIYMLITLGFCLLLSILYGIFLPSSLDLVLSVPEQIHKGDEVRYSCDLTLLRRYPIFYGKIYGRIRNITTKEMQKIEIPFSMFSNKKVSFSVVAEHAGVLECRIERVDLFGILSMMQKTIHIKEKNQLVVFPEMVNLPMEFKTEPVFSENGEEIIMGPQGYDPAIYDGVHEYREGDSLKWIHWNLTGKTDEYMVRELGRPATVLPGLFFETSLYRSDLNQLDRMIGVYASISVKMLSNHLAHEWVFWDEDTAEWVTFRVAKTEDIEDALLRLGISVMKLRDLLTIPELPAYIWSKYNQMTYVADLRPKQAGEVLNFTPIPMSMLVGEHDKWNYYDAVL